MGVLVGVCIYAIKHQKDWDSEFDLNPPLVKWTENHEWTTAQKWIVESLREGTVIPILFADASEGSEITHYGLLAGHEVQEKITTYSVACLRKFTVPLSKNTLIVISTNQPLPATDQRSYRLCHTPKESV